MSEGERYSPALTNRSLIRFTRGNGSDGIAFSNEVRTPVEGGSFDLQKSASPAAAGLGDAITYTLTLTNQGYTYAEAVLYDDLPEGTAFVANSVLAAGVPLAGASPVTGIPAGTVAPGTAVTVSFQLVVTGLGQRTELANRAWATLRYETEGGREVVQRVESNVANVGLRTRRLDADLTAATSSTFVGDAVTFRLVLRNGGNEPLTGIAVRFTASAGAAFLPGSVIIGGVYSPAADPWAGIGLPQLAPGGTVTLSFQVRVTELPPDRRLNVYAEIAYRSAGSSTLIANAEASVTIIQPGISIQQNTGPCAAPPGSSLLCEYIVVNQGTYAAECVLTCELPPEILFEWDSAACDGIPLPGAHPQDGIPLGIIPAGASVRVTFSVRLPRLEPMPGNAFCIEAAVRYTFVLADGRSVSMTAGSSPLCVTVAGPELTVRLNLSPSITERGGSVAVSVTVRSGGNVPARVVLSGLIPEGTRLDPGSLTAEGNAVPDIPAGGVLEPGTIQAGRELHAGYRLIAGDEAYGVIRWRVLAIASYSVGGTLFTEDIRSNRAVLTIEEADE